MECCNLVVLGVFREMLVVEVREMVIVEVLVMLVVVINLLIFRM